MVRPETTSGRENAGADVPNASMEEEVDGIAEFLLLCLTELKLRLLDEVLQSSVEIIDRISLNPRDFRYWFAVRGALLRSTGHLLPADRRAGSSPAAEPVDRCAPDNFWRRESSVLRRPD